MSEEWMHSRPGRRSSYRYILRENAVMAESGGKCDLGKRATAGDAIHMLAWIVEECRYTENDFAELDWSRMVLEPPVPPNRRLFWLGLSCSRPSEEGFWIYSGGNRRETNCRFLNSSTEGWTK
jgi:hypothetical protein